MGRYNLHPSTSHQEAPVKKSHSFADSSRSDVNIIRQGKLSRVITYLTPPDESLGLRQSLANRHLVLGEKIEGQQRSLGGRTLEGFVIPDLARPIAWDKRTSKKGPYNRDDQQLFFSLGRLLGLVAGEGSELPIVLEEAIGLNVALAIDANQNERRRLGEPAILLVPGFERGIGKVEDDDAALGFYDAKLFDEFGQRFEVSQDRFEEGFHTTLGWQ